MAVSNMYEEKRGHLSKLKRSRWGRSAGGVGGRSRLLEEHLATEREVYLLIESVPS